MLSLSVGFQLAKSNSPQEDTEDTEAMSLDQLGNCRLLANVIPDERNRGFECGARAEDGGDSGFFERGDVMGGGWFRRGRR